MYSVERMRRDGACFAPSRQEWEFEKCWMDEEDIRALPFISCMDVPRAARPVPRGARDWEACKEPSLRSPVPWQDGTMAPYATPCPMHGPWTRFPFKFEWDLAGRPDTVGPARDFRVLPHGMIIMGQG
jgi:hypothetical protein